MPSAAGSFAIMLASVTSVPKSNATSDTAANAFVIAVFAASVAAASASNSPIFASAATKSSRLVTNAC
jgi:hypothetical protein